jgi:cytochrome c biogenesis protein
LSSDPAAYADWLTSMKPQYGGWTVVLDQLGLFSVLTSFWFKAVNVLLVTSVLACSVNRAPRLWKLAVHPRTQMSETFFTHAPLRAAILVDAAPDKALENVRGVLKSHHFRTVADPDDKGLNMYADRFRWGPFGTVMAHLSFVIIVLGVFLTETTGFKDQAFTAPVGEKVAVGHATGLSVESKSFTDTYYEDGAPKDYVSDIILYKDGAQVERKMLRMNHPMTQDGVSFYLSSFGLAASMKVTDAAGKTLYGKSVPLAWTSEDGTHVYGSFEMPTKGLTVYVVSAASGKPDPQIKAGQVQLEIHQAGKTDPISTEVVSQGKAATIGDLSYTFERTRQYTQLIVARDPGANVVWLGSILLVLGLFLVFFFPHRRVWVRIRKTPTGSEILCASTMKRDVAFKPQFHQLVTDIQLVGTSSSTIQKVGQNDA